MSRTQYPQSTQSLAQSLSLIPWQMAHRFPRSWLLLLLISILATVKAGSTPGNYFITPQSAGGTSDYSNNQNYTIGQTLQLQWATNITTSLSLWLFQEQNPTPITIFANQYPVPTTYEWTVAIPDFDLSDGTGKRHAAVHAWSDRLGADKGASVLLHGRERDRRQQLRGQFYEPLLHYCADWQYEWNLIFVIDDKRFDFGGYCYEHSHYI